MIQRLASNAPEGELREGFVQNTQALFPPLPMLTPRQAAKQKYSGLTRRECEVAAWIVQGKSNRELAAFPDIHVTTDDLLMDFFGVLAQLGVIPMPGL